MTKEKIGETIERVALSNVMTQAIINTREYLCQDCLDRRCLADTKCKAFLTLAKSFAWEIVADKAELN